VSVGIDVARNTVAVGVEGPMDGTEQSLRTTFGSAVDIRPGEPAQLDTCSSMSYCWPLKGGIRMYLTGDTIKKCTTGFLVRRNDNDDLMALTAGHCLAINNMSGSDTWGHAMTPTGAGNFGWEQAYVWSEYARADVGLVKLNASAVSALAGASKNVVHHADPSTNLSVVAVTSNANQKVGDMVCRMGWGTWDDTGQGKSCGTITVVDETNLSCDVDNDPCYHIQHTWKVNFDSLPGDSGGPITRLVPVPALGINVLYAYGTHVHSGSPSENVGWYSPIGMGSWAFSTTHGYGYTVCTTIDC
jgi:hypothetical protein